MLKQALLCSFVLLIMLGCSDEQTKSSKKAAALPVETIQLKQQNIPIWMPYTGKTQANSSQEVRARVSGVLEEVYYQDGEYVRKGQKLFKIEQTDYQAALQTAQAKKRRDQAALKLAQADVNRYKPLVSEGLAPRVTLEQYQAQVEALKADILSDEAKIKQAELELSYTVITSPIDGQASRRLVDVGNLVGKAEATLLTTINNTDPLYVYFAPGEEEFQKISQLKSSDRMDAYIELNYDSPLLASKPIFGFVNFSDNAVDPSTSTVSMRAQIPNPEHTLLAGTFVYVNIFVTDKFKLMGVPPQVIFEDQRGKYLYIVDDDSKAKSVYIEPVYESRFLTLFKSDQLKDGDEVIINALMKLKPAIEVHATDMTESKGLDAIIKTNKLLPPSHVNGH